MVGKNRGAEPDGQGRAILFGKNRETEIVDTSWSVKNRGAADGQGKAILLGKNRSTQIVDTPWTAKI